MYRHPELLCFLAEVAAVYFRLLPMLDTAKLYFASNISSGLRKAFYSVISISPLFLVDHVFFAAQHSLCLCEVHEMQRDAFLLSLKIDYLFQSLKYL